MDRENAHPPSCRADADTSSIPIGGTQGTRCDDPKTSEYAYFNKLKKDASKSFCPLPEEDDQLKKFKSLTVVEVGSSSNASSLLCRRYTIMLLDCYVETKNMVKDSSKDLKSSLQIKEFTPVNFNSFLSPHGGASKNSGMHCIRAFKNILNTTLVIKWLNSFLSPFGGASKNSDMALYPSPDEVPNPVEHVRSVDVDLKGASTLLGDTCSILKNTGECSNASKTRGTQCIDEEAFSRKRQKLRQWVDTSFPEIDALYSKGYDFISVLLSRLSPKTSENKIDNSKEKLLWKWDLGSPPPTCPPCKFHLQYQKQKLDCDLDGESSACLWTENDSTSDFSFEKYGLAVSSHLKELDEFHGQKELMLGSETHSLLLDWDFDNMKGDEILSIASPNMDLDMNSTLPISLADDYWQSGDNRFDASGLFPSSLLSYTSLTHSYSDSYHNYDHGQHSLEERKCLVAKLHHFPLTLSYCPNLTEYCTYDYTCKDGSIVCSPQDHHWSMSMFFNEKQHPGLEALLLSSGFDFDLRQNHFLLTDYPGEHHSSAYQALQFPQKEGICSHFVEDEFTSWLDNSNHKETLGCFSGDILNIGDWSSINLLMSLNKERACPLLLDKSSWVVSEAETDIDDCEGKHT
ncbi:hypothetical protein CK203_068955 [Vitis vinifera]|uniref:Uncharacterized protein n=1 Tax=Vitis vinifera TaxID=29760 RepID=A0A438F162_VITVI|nr:hypothetical protein CK203_068955 [Vitis vinifera]